MDLWTKPTKKKTYEKVLGGGEAHLFIILFIQ